MSDAVPSSNRAVVWTGPRRLAIQQIPVQAPGVDEVLVEVVSTGICGSDSHTWESNDVSRSMVLGHESAGIVRKVGKNVKGRHVGQRVAIEPGDACLECEFCLQGRPNICADLKYCNIDPVDGTLCQYYTCRAARTVPIPDTVSWTEAGTIQPLAVAVQMARRASLSISHTVAIFGCGPLGLLVLAVARTYGVKTIVMFDVDPSRAAFAKIYGADKGVTMPPFSGSLEEAPAYARQVARQTVAEHGLDHGFDIVVEASGAAICVQLAVAMLKSGGTLLQAGLGRPLTLAPLFEITARELTVKGTVRYTPGCFADAIHLLASGRVDVKPLITATYPLTRASDAFEAQHAREGIKIIIMNQE